MWLWLGNVLPALFIAWLASMNRAIGIILIAIVSIATALLIIGTSQESQDHNLFWTINAYAACCMPLLGAVLGYAAAERRHATANKGDKSDGA